MKIFRIWSMVVLICSMSVYVTPATQPKLIQAEGQTKNQLYQVAGHLGSLQNSVNSGVVESSSVEIRSTEEDIHINSSRLLDLFASDDIELHVSDGFIRLNAPYVDIAALQDIHVNAMFDNVNINAGNNVHIEASNDVNLGASGDINMVTYNSGHPLNANLMAVILHILTKAGITPTVIGASTFTGVTNFGSDGTLHPIVFDGETFSLTLDQSAGNLLIAASGGTLTNSTLYLGDGISSTLATSTPETATIVFNANGEITLSGTV